MRSGVNMNYKLMIYLLLLTTAVIADETVARKTIMPFGRPPIAEYKNNAGKVYNYYTLIKGQSMGFAVEGPVHVDIRTRAGLPRPEVTADYQVQVWEDEYLIAAEKFKSKKVDSEILKSKLTPAAYRAVAFETPAGVHNYRIWLVSDNIDTVFLRIYRSESAATAPVKVNMYPLEYFKQVHLYSKKNQTPYYLVSKDDGVKLKISGPSEFIVRARANFNTGMEGRIGYALSMIEDGEEINTLSATTSKSLTMAYQDYTGVVPSKPTQFIVQVPAGNHTYEFRLKESTAETVSIRFTLPKQDQDQDDDDQNDAN
jgi:hypothetical protein